MEHIKTRTEFDNEDFDALEFVNSILTDSSTSHEEKIDSVIEKLEQHLEEINALIEKNLSQCIYTVPSLKQDLDFINKECKTLTSQINNLFNSPSIKLKETVRISNIEAISNANSTLNRLNEYISLINGHNEFSILKKSFTESLVMDDLRGAVKIIKKMNVLKEFDLDSSTELNKIQVMDMFISHWDSKSLESFRDCDCDKIKMILECYDELAIRDKFLENVKEYFKAVFKLDPIAITDKLSSDIKTNLLKEYLKRIETIKNLTICWESPKFCRILCDEIINSIRCSKIDIVFIPTPFESTDSSDDWLLNASDLLQFFQSLSLALTFLDEEIHYFHKSLLEDSFPFLTKYPQILCENTNEKIQSTMNDLFFSQDVLCLSSSKLSEFVTKTLNIFEKQFSAIHTIYNCSFSLEFCIFHKNILQQFFSYILQWNEALMIVRSPRDFSDFKDYLHLCIEIASYSGLILVEFRKYRLIFQKSTDSSLDSELADAETIEGIISKALTTFKIRSMDLLLTNLTNYLMAIINSNDEEDAESDFEVGPSSKITEIGETLVFLLHYLENCVLKNCSVMYLLSDREISYQHFADFSESEPAILEILHKTKTSIINSFIEAYTSDKLAEIQKNNHHMSRSQYLVDTEYLIGLLSDKTEICTEKLQQIRSFLMNSI